MTNKSWTNLTGTAIIFITFEIVLVLYVDRALSQSLRTIDKDHQYVVDVFRNYTDLGLGKWYIWTSALMMITCFALSRLRHISEYQQHILQWLAETGGFFFACTAGSGLLTDILKPLFGRMRPKLLGLSDMYGFQPLTFHADWNSLPSGHSTTGFAVAFALMSLFPHWRWPLLMFAIAIALSRVMVNAHYLSDVLAGAVVAWIVTNGCKVLFSRKGWMYKKNSVIINYPWKGFNAG